MKLKFLSGFLLILFGALPVRATTIYSVAIDTTTWSGLNGILAFDLTGGDAAVANNTATIGGFATNGTLSSSAPIALTDSAFFNETLRSITFGTTLSFTLQLTENRTPPGFDQFSFFLLDAVTLLPMGGTTDPTGANALFAIDINGASGGNLSLFSSLAPGISWRVTTPSPAGVPDRGSTFGLLAAALIAIVSMAGFQASAPKKGTNHPRDFACERRS